MNYYEKHPEKAICLDVETTGVDPNTAEIVQLSIIDYNGNTLFNEYIKPDKAKIWPGAEAVHHISPLKVINKPHLGFYYNKLKRIFDDAELIIAYNGDHYDIPIIARYGFPELRSKKSYDVMLEFAPIYGAWDDYHSSYTWQKLNVCADYYGYRGDDNFHDSLEDVRATLFCYKKMKDKQPTENSNTKEESMGSSYDYLKLAENLKEVCEELDRNFYSMYYFPNIYVEWCGESEEKQKQRQKEAVLALESICLGKTLGIAERFFNEIDFEQEKKKIIKAFKSQDLEEMEVWDSEGNRWHDADSYIFEDNCPDSMDYSLHVDAIIRKFFGVSPLF